MNISDLELLCSADNRIPLEYREHKDKAKALLELIKVHKISARNKYLSILASWCGVEFDTYDPKQDHSEVISVIPSGNQMTLDMEVQGDHSYKGNGMILHNCNLPNSATKSIVSDVYMKAWESGCKGFTVYRDGCRDGVLVEKKTETRDTAKIFKTQAPKRPKELKCDVHHIKVKGQEYFVIVGLWEDGTPYEIFAGKNGQIAHSIKHGIITKKSRGEYCCTFDDGSETCNIAKFINEEQEAITRLASLGLRHGCDINFLVHQLEKTNGTLDSFSKALVRALKKYLKDGTKVHGESCGSCGSTSIERREGCVTCVSCGWSKCG